MVILRAAGLALSLLFAQTLAAHHGIEHQHANSNCETCIQLPGLDSLLADSSSVAAGLPDEADRKPASTSPPYSTARRNGHPCRAPPIT